VTDARDPNSLYETAFFHDTNLPPAIRPQILPNRNSLFEFTLIQSERGAQAVDITLVGQARESL
jgi:hypothetical protein